MEYRSGLTRYDVQRDPVDHRLEPEDAPTRWLPDGNAGGPQVQEFAL